MKRIGITGQAGFVGKHLFNTLTLHPETFSPVPFQRDFFESEASLDAFVSQCDVIVHLAGMNRHSDQQVIYDTNVRLTSALVAALKRTGATPHVLFSSSVQEEKDNLYGRSKKDSRLLLQQWAEESGALFTGLLIPNVFGPFGNPFYNSVVATFCHQLCNDETPTIKVDAELPLIYVGELVKAILTAIGEAKAAASYTIPHTSSKKVSEILALLLSYKEDYCGKGIIPALPGSFELQLFNTFRSYEQPARKNPVKLVQHVDERGSFTEIIRLCTGGQVSFSVTVPGVTRGNHFHTRKIERFAVIKGQALIQLRRIGTSEVIDIELSGDEPSYVDMPVWYSHNIKNTGDTDLYTLFWINEFYDPKDPDTYFEPV